MYVYEVSYIPTREINTIIGKSISEICGEILYYNNGVKIDSNKNIAYNVNFLNYKGDLVLSIPESGLLYALFGEDINETITDSMKEYSHKYWLMDQETIQVIEFNNPIHPGEAVWDREYYENNQEDNEDEIEQITYDDSDTSNEETNRNVTLYEG